MQTTTTTTTTNKEKAAQHHHLVQPQCQPHRYGMCAFVQTRKFCRRGENLETTEIQTQADY